MNGPSEIFWLLAGLALLVLALLAGIALLEWVTHMSMGQSFLWESEESDDV